MNIRQSGRRRGRNNNNGGGGGNRPQGGNRGGHDSGNRVDSRTRGNAVQMIEKYKNLARDAQLSGDRVQTEYFLQFADHYFRVMSDFRARQDEGRPQGQERWQGRNEGVENFDGRDDMDLGEPQTSSNTDGYGADDDGDERGDMPRRDAGENRSNREPRDNREGREPRVHRDNRDNRDGRSPNRNRPRDDRPDRSEPRAEQGDRPVRAERPERVERPERAAQSERSEPAERAIVDERGNDRPRARRPRRDVGDDADTGGTIDTAVLPPAIARPVDTSPVVTGPVATSNDDTPAAEAAPKVRRPRRTLTKPVSEAEAAE